MRILVVEDNEWRMNLLRRWLTRHDVTYARAASEAISALARGAFDLLLLDHDLGGRTFVPSDDAETGAEVARYLHRHHITLHTIVHSHNPEGVVYIKSLLPDAEAIPWGEHLSMRLRAFAPPDTPDDLRGERAPASLT